MGEWPLISVVTPSFQQGEFIEKTIRSVILQKYPNLEYIIIDGGSTDSTVEVIEKYSESISFWVSEKDDGQSHAINKGLNRAKGDLITWLNSDDYYEDGILMKIARKYRENKNCACIYGKTRIFRQNGWEKVTGGLVKDMLAKTMSCVPFSQPSSFFNGKIYRDNNLSIREDLHYGMDYEFFLRLKQYGPFVYLDEVFSNYLVHGESKTFNDKPKFAEEWRLIYNSAVHSLDPDNQILKELSRLSLDVKEYLPMNLDLSSSNEQFRLSFYFFLEWQATFRFHSGDISKVKLILDYILETFPEGSTNAQILKMRKRLMFFPKAYFFLNNMRSKLFN